MCNVQVTRTYIESRESKRQLKSNHDVRALPLPAEISFFFPVDFPWTSDFFSLPVDFESHRIALRHLLVDVTASPPS